MNSLVDLQTRGRHVGLHVRRGHVDWHAFSTKTITRKTYMLNINKIEEEFEFSMTRPEGIQSMYASYLIKKRLDIN